jgi:tetratricopeptide (TPR) repeat protein
MRSVIGRIRVQGAALAVLMGAVVGVAPAAAAGERPAEILSWRHQVLDREQYTQLAREWEGYATAHPRDARARVYWGHALRYTGDWRGGQAKYAEAFSIDSTDAAAIVHSATAGVVEEQNAGWRRDYARLQRAARDDPDYPDTYYCLWNGALRAGDEELAANCLRAVVKLGDMPRPLLDYGANMVEGAPEGAIILTNGDNDTYPPLAYQAITGRRRDVSIVNLSLLNVPWYVRYWKSRGLPIPLDDAEIRGIMSKGKGGPVAGQVVQALWQELCRTQDARPLFYAVTVTPEGRTVKGRRILEGVLERIRPGGGEESTGEVDWQRTRLLFDTVYRIDGGTDPLLDWKRESSVGKLMLNYATLLSDLGMHLIQEGNADAGETYLFKAVSLLAKHWMPEYAQETLRKWEGADPNGRLLPEARRLLDS